jgi:hypothetical protein
MPAGFPAEAVRPPTWSISGPIPFPLKAGMTKKNKGLNPDLEDRSHRSPMGCDPVRNEYPGARQREATRDAARHSTR